MSWPMVALDSVTRRGSGHTPSQKHSEYWDGGVKWVSLADSSALDRGYIQDTAKKISAQGLAKSSAVLHPKGTVIVSRDAGVGKSAILGDTMAVSQHFIAWVCDEDRLCPEYLYQWLQSNQKVFERMAVGSTIKTIGLSYFARLRIPLPERQIQTKISQILFGWDAAIDRMEQLIAAKETRKTALAMELLTRRAAQWSRARLSDISERIQRQDPEGKHPLLTISSSRGFVRQEDKYSRNMAGESAKTYTLLDEGDFSYNKGNSLRYEFGCIYQLHGYKAALVPSVYVSFKLNKGIDHAYMRHLFASDYLRPQLRALVKTGVRNNGLLNISPAEFLSTTVPLPPLPLQQRIGKMLDSSQKEIDLLQQQLNALRAQKSGLMKKLLTGQWPVKAGRAQAA